ncbi:MAG TPA: D-glycero-beta-D-manno-heptose 1,7-bisphosphate 7-phosphatase [Blastocatellia bacterium]|nr:D-glycero-beta-D-manno-heptose 1,7-bisphosphate 7-phosphatase [Blastocatellia bacterium]
MSVNRKSEIRSQKSDNPQSQNPQSVVLNPQSSPAIFIDRDGTINEDLGYISRPDDLLIYPGVAEAVRLVNKAGLKTIVVTNQSGVARGFYSEDDLREIHNRMISELQKEDARIDAVYYCPHHPDYGDELYRKDCECRKPRPGMLYAAAREHNIDLARSFVIGDKASDINLAANAGARGALVLTGYGKETLAHQVRWPCEPDFVADSLLRAVEAILDERRPRR